jgi:hypothetical protein
LDDRLDDEEKRFPVRCDCGHAEGDHEDTPVNPCLLAGCGCTSFTPCAAES